ncbi:MAG: M28 family peptidase [Planctomycetes bacterium]|nr:M28 family peptidase [Planctomycetota bacterium]
MRRRTALAALSLWIAVPLPGQEQDPFESAKKEIDADAMKTVLSKLASDEFEGRGTLTPGIRKAREYIEARLKEWNVAPVGSGYELPCKPWCNLGALHRGSDPRLKDEVIVLGSHYDHLGRARKPVDGDDINNGADDNASGSTLNLFVAKALAASKLRTKRSILHLWFDGEEQGLNGSKSYCQDPVVPMDRIAAMVNCDMVGRPEETGAKLWGVGSSLQFEPCGANARRRAPDAKVNLLEEKGPYFHRSDQAPFWSRGVPVMFLFGTMHGDYHRVTDHADKIDYPKLAELAKFVLALVVELADYDGKIERNPDYK